MHLSIDISTSQYKIFTAHPSIFKSYFLQLCGKIFLNSAIKSWITVPKPLPLNGICQWIDVSWADLVSEARDLPNTEKFIQ